MPDQSENISRPSAPVPSGNWKDLRARVLSAAVLVPLAALCVWVGGLVYGAMIVLAMVGMAAEWARMFGFGLDARRGQLCLVWAACTGVAAVAGHWGGALLVMAAALVLGPALWAGQVAIGCAGLSLLWLRYMSEPGAGVVLFLVACVALSDTGAYMAGRLFGGPKLAPRISPAKTWSGSVGGLCCAVVAGMLIAALLPGAQPGAVWGGLCSAGLSPLRHRWGIWRKARSSVSGASRIQVPSCLAMGGCWIVLMACWWLLPWRPCSLWVQRVAPLSGMWACTEAMVPAMECFGE